MYYTCKGRIRDSQALQCQSVRTCGVPRWWGLMAPWTAPHASRWPTRHLAHRTAMPTWSTAVWACPSSAIPPSATAPVWTVKLSRKGKGKTPGFRGNHCFCLIFALLQHKGAANRVTSTFSQVKKWGCVCIHVHACLHGPIWTMHNSVTHQGKQTHIWWKRFCSSQCLWAASFLAAYNSWVFLFNKMNVSAWGGATTATSCLLCIALDIVQRCSCVTPEKCDFLVPDKEHIPCCLSFLWCLFLTIDICLPCGTVLSRFY